MSSSFIRNFLKKFSCYCASTFIQIRSSFNLTSLFDKSWNLFQFGLFLHSKIENSNQNSIYLKKKTRTQCSRNGPGIDQVYKLTQFSSFSWNRSRWRQQQQCYHQPQLSEVECCLWKWEISIQNSFMRMNLSFNKITSKSFFCYSPSTFLPIRLLSFCRSFV